MPEVNGQQPAGRSVELTGDSTELIAFALLRYLAQLEHDSGKTFDRAWMLDAYAECLEAAKGSRKLPGSQKRPSTERTTKKSNQKATR